MSRTRTTTSRPAAVRPAIPAVPPGRYSHGRGRAQRITVSDGGNAHGAVTADMQDAAPGDLVTITATPAAGYVLDTLRVTDAAGNPVALTLADGQYTFVMPDAAVTIESTFRAAGAAFADVPADSYFYAPVQWAVANGITSGVRADAFGPELGCTRAQTVTFLWRAAGCPAPSAEASPFADISPDDYFYDAVLWGGRERHRIGHRACGLQPGRGLHPRPDRHLAVAQRRRTAAGRHGSLCRHRARRLLRAGRPVGGRERHRGGHGGRYLQPGRGLHPRPDRHLAVPRPDRRAVTARSKRVCTTTARKGVAHRPRLFLCAKKIAPPNQAALFFDSGPRQIPARAGAGPRESDRVYRRSRAVVSMRAYTSTNAKKKPEVTVNRMWPATAR